jgi:hypothetical protein
MRSAVSSCLQSRTGSCRHFQSRLLAKPIWIGKPPKQLLLGSVGIVDDYRLEIVCHLFFALSNWGYHRRVLEMDPSFDIKLLIGALTRMEEALSLAQPMGFGMGYLQKRS